MYSLIDGFIRNIMRKEQFNILLLGLDNSGKTTLLERLKEAFIQGYKGIRHQKITTTVGLNIAKLFIGRQKIILWDVGGQSELQTLWDKYYSESHGVIFVVDSSDQRNVLEAKKIFQHVIQDPDLEHIPILIMVNKQDLPTCVPLCDVKEILNECAGIVGVRDCRVIPASALQGEGVVNGLQWLVSCAKRNQFRPAVLAEF